MKSCSGGSAAPAKILLHIESQPVISRLLRRILKKRQDIALLRTRFDEQALVFIRRVHPEYIVANLDDLGNSPGEICEALAMLNEIHAGKLLVSGYDTSLIQQRCGEMRNVVVMDFPFTTRILALLGDGGEPGPAG
ncbi:hypothetical protein [Sulfuriflexus sp.]|uniref:hypothetical protein n=1 Tax=Sulfuriflexus sp. TaxID=2015443 RepID=UPI0028CD10E7|nr:hypothetical protein [Sulfuriflexus sp.]MDT8405033.1 hypothetical protein [Sulfuriflexus sp.]